MMIIVCFLKRHKVTLLAYRKGICPIKTQIQQFLYVIFMGHGLKCIECRKYFVRKLVSLMIVCYSGKERGRQEERSKDWWKMVWRFVWKWQANRNRNTDCRQVAVIVVYCQSQEFIFFHFRILLQYNPAVCNRARLLSYKM